VFPLKRAVGVIVALACLAGGCNSQPPADSVQSQNLFTTSNAPTPPARDNTSTAVSTPSAPQTPQTDTRVIARVNGEPITLHDLIDPLLASRGLPLLLNIAQLNMARQDARDAHVTVTPEDVKKEQELTLERLFKDRDQKEQDKLADAEAKHDTEKVTQLRAQIHEDREKFLDQYLDTQHVSRVEYDLVIELNAYLRKSAEINGKGKITDEMVERQFGLEYGETAKCRVIQCNNMREIQEAQQRLRAGEDFAQVAKSMSRNARTAPLGGEMPPFSLQTQGIPQEFRQLAFSLQPGQISDPLVLGDNYYLIKLEQKFAPKAVKFADVKEILRKNMYDALTEKIMTDLRENLGQQVMQKLTITEPLLSRQFEDLKAKQEGAIKERQKMNEQWRKEREAAATQNAAPAGPPAPATQPAPTTPQNAPAAPATRPGAL
jgi:parvulin-like peptidyl-prolyl isomerase